MQSQAPTSTAQSAAPHSQKNVEFFGVQSLAKQHHTLTKMSHEKNWYFSFSWLSRWLYDSC